MAASDFIYATFKCLDCDIEAEQVVATKLRSSPNGATFKVGDEFEIAPEIWRNTFGYLVLRQLGDVSSEIRLIEEGGCEKCSAPKPYRWVEIILDGMVLKSVSPVRLTREVLGRANAVSDVVIDLLEDRGLTNARDLPVEDAANYLLTTPPD